MLYKKLNKIIALILIELILILPVYTAALTISNIQVDASDKSAFVTWQTDEESATEISYGKDTANLNNTISDVNLVKDHSVLLRNLEKSTAYFFELTAQTPTETLVDDKSGEYYKFLTLAEDTVEPFIDVELPEAVDSNELDIVGKTEIESKIELFVNGQARRVVDFSKNTLGELKFYGVDLLPNEQNIIFLKVTDLAGNTAQKQFTVYSDLVAPVITFTPELPDVIDASSINIIGTLSEISLFNVTLNDASIYSAETASFSFNTQLTEGENRFVIKAKDKSGRETIIEKTVISDTLPPTLINVTPVSGSFYYEGRGIIDLQFATEPNAEVRVYRDGRGILAKYDETRTADANGNVRFNDVELEGVHFGPFSVSAEWPPMREVQATTQRVVTSQTTQQGTEAQQRTVKLIIAVRDIADHVTIHTMSYTIGTCWSGELDFHISNMIEYNTPTLLSPERLEEGSELISFVLNVSYEGGAKDPSDWQITDVRFDKACRGGRLGEPEFFLEEDIRYDVSCSILPSSPTTKDRNTAGTLWYVRYDLGSTAEFTNFTEVDWEEIGRRELIFPLKLTVRYKEREVNPTTGRKEWSGTKTQTKCMQVAYFVDIPIDPRDVLPDAILEDLPDAMNNTINSINDILNTTEEITEYIAIGCLSSLLIKFVTQIIRKITCRLNTRSAKIAKSVGKEATCPTTDDGRMSLPLNNASRKGVTVPTKLYRPSGKAENPEYPYLETACSGCANAWKAEAGLYQLERWLCDRILCHKAPAKWTAFEKGVKDEQIKLAEKKSRTCGDEDKAGVLSLSKIENCARTYGPSGRNVLSIGFETRNLCYLYENTLYVEATTPLAADADGFYTLTKASKGGEGPGELKVIKEGSNYATARNKNCDDICKEVNRKAVGSCEAKKTCVEVKGKLDAGTLMGYSNDCWYRQDAIKDKEQCCCRTEKGVVPEPPVTTVNCKVGQTPGKDCQDWEYREQELNRKDKKKYGTYYPENRYFEGRDLPACFGQNYFFETPAKGKPGKVPTLDPFRQHLSTFQCLCLTGIRQRLIMLKNILTGMRNCLIQIRETGDADVGVCKEMFTQYVCDVVYQVYLWFKRGCIPNPFGDDITLGGRSTGVGGTNVSAPSVFSIVGGEMFGTVRDMGSSIGAEYGSSQFSNYLSMGERELSRKICLAAFGFDVGWDFDTLLDMTYNTQFASSVLALGLRRDFLTYNPDNELATYAYRGSWTIYPGCEIISYKVDLTCVNQQEKSKYRGIDCTTVADPENPTGCDCLMQSSPYAARSKLFYTGGPLSATAMEDKDHHTNVESQFRYDHLRIQLFLHPEADKSKCLPTGYDEGIFYFPITDRTARDLLDCTLDLERGQFRCSRGLEWEQKGEARFDYFTKDECKAGESCNLLCNNPYESSAWIDCKNVTYTAGKNIQIKPKIRGKGSQCLKATLTAENGEKVYDEMHSIGQSGFEQEYTESNPISLTTVRPDQFAGGGVSIDSTTKENCTIGDISNVSSRMPGQTLNLEWEKTVEAGITKFKPKTIPTGLKIYDQSGTEVGFIGSKAASEIEKLSFGFAGFRFKFTKIEPGRCIIKTKAGTGSENQIWQLSLELYHPDAQGSCAMTAGRVLDRIFIVGQETSIDRSLDVRKSYSPPAAGTVGTGKAADVIGLSGSELENFLKEKLEKNEMLSSCNNNKLDEGESCDIIDGRIVLAGSPVLSLDEDFLKINNTIQISTGSCLHLATDDCYENNANFDISSIKCFGCYAWSPLLTCIDDDSLGDDGQSKWYPARLYYSYSEKKFDRIYWYKKESYVGSDSSCPNECINRDDNNLKDITRKPFAANNNFCS
ncbi:fibronectin type III domain-containing protein [Candidatus Woesearchaeota archaeon]|nr:fibronectin type III domain-containing protein [Candidatus Woesearchaeota archaeon]